MLSVVVGPLLGETTLHFPLYAVEAVAAEAVALVVSTRRPIPYGAAAGAAIGTFGLAAEWALVARVDDDGLARLAAAGGRDRGPARRRRRRRAGRAPSAARSRRPPSGWRRRRAGPSPPRWLATVAAVAYPLPISAGDPVTAQVTLTDVTGPPARTVDAEVKLTPADAADDAEWFKVTAWQGGGAIVEDLERTGPGTYRTTEPVPVHGNWKVTLRLHTGSAIQGLPIYLPEDTRDPGQGGPGRGEHDPQVRARQEEPPARAEVGRAGRADHRRLPASCWRS